MTTCLCCKTRDAGHRYACDWCVNGIRRLLRELEDYVAVVLSMRGSIGSKPHGSVGVSFGSKPPMSLTAAALLDVRSAAPDAADDDVHRKPNEEAVRTVLLRDSGQCTWLTGRLAGGPSDYLEGGFDPGWRCPARASQVDTIANPEEFDPGNLRSLCGPHLTWSRRRRTLPDVVDPVGHEAHDHVRSLPAAVHGIAEWVRGERDESNPTKWTLVSELRYLATTVDWCAQQPWVDDLHADLRDLHSTARALAKDQPPGPMGHCLVATCSGTVFPATVKDSSGRQDGGRCDTCGDTYTGTRLLRLGAQEAG